MNCLLNYPDVPSLYCSLNFNGSIMDQYYLSYSLNYLSYHIIPNNFLKQYIIPNHVRQKNLDAMTI